MIRLSPQRRPDRQWPDPTDRQIEYKLLQLTIDVLTKGASTTVPIDTSQPVFVGISLTKGHRLDVKVQSRPYGYL